MHVINLLSLVLIIYGLLGLFGIQSIKPEYKNHRWTKSYKRMRGIVWIALGVLWGVIDYLSSIHLFSGTIDLILTIVAAVFVGIYTAMVEIHFRNRMDE